METSASVPKKQILVVDDDPLIRDALKITLNKENYEVTTATDGKSAQQILALNQFDLLITDIQMPNSPVNGFELLHFTKKSAGIPVILMTGFAGITESEDAVKLGASGFLTKPFLRPDLISVIHSSLYSTDTAPATTTTPSSTDAKDPNAEPPTSPDDYCKLGIDDFISGRQIKFGVYIQLSKGKFIKVAHEGEDISIDRIKTYRQKGVKYLYLLKEDFQNYMRMSLSLGQALRRAPNISKEKKLNFLKHSSEVVMEYIHANEFKAESFDAAKSIAENSIQYLMEDSETFSLLQILNNHSDYLYAHSLATSMYATMISYQVKWNSHSTLYRVSIAGLLHDIGKKDIDKALLVKTKNDLTPEEISLLETHTVRGMETLSKIQSIPTELAQIVLQHHETDAGSGYPSGLNKRRIHPLARLVSVANVFAEFVISGPYGPGLKPKEALDRMMALYGKILEPSFIEALTNSLKNT